MSYNTAVPVVFFRYRFSHSFERKRYVCVFCGNKTVACSNKLKRCLVEVRIGFVLVRAQQTAIHFVCYKCFFAIKNIFLLSLNPNFSLLLPLPFLFVPIHPLTRSIWEGVAAFFSLPVEKVSNAYSKHVGGVCV